MSQHKDAIMARIRALQAKTTAQGCTEAEADAAAAMVDKLLEQYELTLDEVSLRATAEVEMATIEKIGKHAVRFAGPAIANFTDTKVWLDNDDKDLVFLGLDVDIQIAEYLTLLFWRAIDRESGAYILMNPDVTLAPGHVQGEMKWAFEVGCSQRLGERLRTLKSKRDFAQQQTGTSLVLAKRPLIDDAFATLGIKLSRRTVGAIHHQGAYNAGRSAADGVSISQGVTQRANNTGRIR